MVPFFITLFFSILYVSMQTFSIYAGDSGELVTAAYTWGIAHPPGYPLYTFLGGILTHTIPFSTVAWRMGILSSLPMAVSLYFMWKIIFQITKSKIGATVGSICYGFLYPVWLYAIVPEVFGLFSFFSALLLFVFFHYIETKNQRYAFLLSFLSGLSLTHQYLIVFLLFSVSITFFLSYKNVLKSMRKRAWMYCLALFLGLCVYVYAPLASSKYPPLDWEHPASPMGFFRLITRASYGTFKASYGTGESLVDRGLNVFTLGEYILKDFTLFGIAFFFIGFFTLWKKKRSCAVFFLIYLGWQMFYFFYAGFRLISDFALGTLERFFIIPYQIVSIVIGIGVWKFLELLRTFWHKHASEARIPFFIIQIIVMCLALVIPIKSMKHNFIPLKALQHDTTLEKLADDIFASTPEGSILNLDDDTSVFTVLYAYYVQKKRQDIRFVMFQQFPFSYYPAWLKRHYTDITIPSTPQALSVTDYLKAFVKANTPYRMIVTERANAAVSEYWVPHGLVVVYYPTYEEVPPKDQILEKNISLWKSFQDPFYGVIGVYRHMMMSDVLRYYSSKRMTLAQSFLLSGYVGQAQNQVSEALRLTPNRLELFVSYIEDLIRLKKCPEALYTLEHITNVYVNQQFYLELFHRLYDACPDLHALLESREKEYQEYMIKYGEKIEK